MPHIIGCTCSLARHDMSHVSYMSRMSHVSYMSHKSVLEMLLLKHMFPRFAACACLCVCPAYYSCLLYAMSAKCTLK